ncbi:MAG TPA: ABC transporter ATP-binding protein [Thermoanaerobaculia bacterium]|nr:ABC transporter ATP-binding protein [Thermoanaerobaculia bacterium]
MTDRFALLRLVRSQRGSYIAASLALLLGTATVLFVPRFLGDVVNSFHLLEAGKSAPAALNALYIIVALLLVDAVATVTYAFMAAIASEKIVNDLRARFYRNMLAQPLDEQSPKHLGEIASEFSSDLSLIQDGLSGTLLNFVRYALTVLGCLGALLYIDLKLTLLAFAGIAVLGTFIVLMIRNANKAIMSIQRYRAKVIGLLLEGAANVTIVQAYNRVDYLSGRFNDALRELFKRVRLFLLLVASISPVSLVLFASVMSVVAYYGMRALQTDNMTVDQLVSYFSYAIVLVMSGSQVGYLAGRLRQSSIMLTKHEGMLTGLAPAAVTDSEPQRQDPASEPYGFLAENVSFAYPGKDAPALTDVTFSLLPGRVNAVVGESGAGKSTLAALLCGLYRPKSGAIRLTQNGTAAGVSPIDVRQEIALVPQEPFLFAASIFENITFGREWISEADVRQAAMSARIHDFIMTLPDGYKTVLQEHGKDLSRGQRQRISIARALAGRPSIMILDEATASLDVVSEQSIKALIDDLRGRVTFVIIAHQGALLANVDRVVILDRGEVAFEGAPGDIAQDGRTDGPHPHADQSLLQRLGALDGMKMRRLS